jgi:hypothetical protein
MNANEVRQRAQRMETFYRAQIEIFGGIQLRQLKDHEQKGNWLEWVPSPCDLRKYIEDTSKQLAITTDRRRVQELSADLANFALKYNDLYGSAAV